MKTKTNLKAGYQTGGHGALTANHNETLANGLRVKTAVKAGPMYMKVAGLRVKTAVKAGSLTANHNETLAAGLRVKTALKASGTHSGGSGSGAGLRVKSALKAGPVTVE
jgi:hypothetical protein